MRVSINEFFALLKNGLSLRSNGPLCGAVYVKEIKGERFLVMHWPEDQTYDLDALGDFKPVVRKPEKIRLDKFERFAKRLFFNAEFFVEVVDPDKDEDHGKQRTK